MEKDDFAKLLDQPQLLKQIFLTNTGHISQDFLGGIESSILTWLGELPSSQRAYFCSEPQLSWDFMQEKTRIKLLNSQQLSALALILGATLHAKELSVVVLRDERKQCQQELGAEIFDFAIKRGQFYVGRIGKVFSTFEPSLSLPKRCQRHGWIVLAGFDADSSWLNLLEKLAGFNIQLPDFLEEISEQLWQLCKKLLLKEVDPTCQLFFNS